MAVLCYVRIEIAMFVSFSKISLFPFHGNHRPMVEKSLFSLAGSYFLISTRSAGTRFKTNSPSFSLESRANPDESFIVPG